MEGFDIEDSTPDPLDAIFEAAQRIARFRQGLLSEKEALALQEWIGESNQHRQWVDTLLKEDKLAETLSEFRALEKENKEAFREVRARAGIPMEKKSPATGKRVWRGVIGGLVCIALVAAIGWYVRHIYSGEAEGSVAIVTGVPDIPPGGNKATLTLSDGRVITLDTAANGLLVQQANAKILKTGAGQLYYKNNTAHVINKLTYNTMTTPLGGLFAVSLSDGSKVWLNAMSSLTYPTTFAVTSRDVTLTGEGYFEISPNKASPFTVTVNKTTTVEVLGTHVNIMAYSDETAMTTTLLEGAVRVTEGHASGVVGKGEQAQLTYPGKLTIMPDADAAEAIAWKEGLFHFDHADLKTILHQVSRWYGVPIAYKGGITDRPFKGEAPRNVHLVKLLEGLGQMANIRFSMENDTLIVQQ